MAIEKFHNVKVAVFSVHEMQTAVYVRERTVWLVDEAGMDTEAIKHLERHSTAITGFEYEV